MTSNHIKARIKLLSIALLSPLLFSACDTKAKVEKPELQLPPIQIEVIAPAVAEQLTSKFGDRFLRVGEVRYDSSSDCYHVEIYHTQKDQEARHALELIKVTKAATPNLTTYECEFPASLFGEDLEASDRPVRVTIDELMNKAQESHQKSEYE